MNNLQRKLRKIGACKEAIRWARKYSCLSKAWRGCRRGDWMLWFLSGQGRIVGPRGRQFVAAERAYNSFNLRPWWVPPSERFFNRNERLLPETVKNLHRAAIVIRKIIPNPGRL